MRSLRRIAVLLSRRVEQNIIGVYRLTRFPAAYHLVPARK